MGQTPTKQQPDQDDGKLNVTLSTQVVESLDCSNRDLSVTGNQEMKELGEKHLQLRTLLLQNCQLTSLENIIYFLSLQHLDLSRNLITSLEDKNEVIFFLKELRFLNLSYNYISSLPELLFNLANLKTLHVSNNNVALVCEEIHLLHNLTDVDLSFNQLAYLPDHLSNLTNLEKCKLNSNEIKGIPALPPSLTFLNLNDNLLKGLPASIGNLVSLKKLYLDSNELLEVPADLGNCSNLRELALNNNQLIDLPNSLGSIKSLTILDLSENLFEEQGFFDPEVPSLLQYIKTKNIKPSRKGKFKSKKRRGDTLRVLPSARNIHRPSAPKAVAAWHTDSQGSSTKGNESTGSFGNGSNFNSNEDYVKQQALREKNSVPLHVSFPLYRFKFIDDVHIGDTKSIVMVDRVVCDYSALNNSDVFVLDGSDAFYIWIGSKSHPSELLKARYMVSKSNAELGASIPVVTLDSKTMKNWEISKNFWNKVGILSESESRNAIKSIRDGKVWKKESKHSKASSSSTGKDDKQNSVRDLSPFVPPSSDQDALTWRIENAKIYKFTSDGDEDSAARIYIVSAGEPAVKSILDSSSCFLIDIPLTPSVYVWSGTYAPPEARSWALLKAEEIMNKDADLNAGFERNLSWNMDDAESWEFKELFFDWLDVEWDPAERERIQLLHKQQQEMMRQIEEESVVVVEEAIRSTKIAIPRASVHSRDDSSTSSIDEEVDLKATQQKLQVLEEQRRKEEEEAEKQLAEKKRRKAEEAATVAAAAAKRDAEKRRQAATDAEKEAERKRQAEREKAIKEEQERSKKEKQDQEAKDKAAAMSAAAEELEKQKVQQKKVDDAAKKDATDQKAKLTSSAKVQTSAEGVDSKGIKGSGKVQTKDVPTKDAAPTKEEPKKPTLKEIAASIPSIPSSKDTPSFLTKSIQAIMESEKSQAKTIEKLWRPPTLDKVKFAAQSESVLGDITDTRGTLLAGPRRAVGPQGRRAATKDAQSTRAGLETKVESAAPTKANIGAFGLLRAVGGEAALLQRKDKATGEAAKMKGDSPEAMMAQKGQPRLIQIKGRRKMLIRQVQLNPNSLNSGDVFILDSGKGMLYQWNGKDANRIAKGKCMDLAKNIKDKEYSGTAKVIVLEEGKSDTNVQDNFWKIIHGHIPNSEVLNPSALPLPSSYSDIKIKTAQEDDDEVEETIKTSTDLYKLVPSKKDRLEPEFVAAYPLKKEILDDKECYILDCVSELYVWCGKSSNIKARKQSLDIAVKLVVARTEFWVAPIIRELPGGESVMFREKFSNWGYGPPIQMQKVAVGKNVAKKGEEEKIDVGALYIKQASRQEVMVDSAGNGEVHVWRIVDFKKVEVPKELYGHFWAGDTFIVLYKYKVGNREAFLVYYWQGRTSTINEKGTSALLTIELDKEFKANGTAKEVRVVQNQEPKHFLLVFKSKYIVHSGKYVDHFIVQNYTSSRSPSSSENSAALYEVCGHSPEYSRLIQVEPSKTCLKSSTSFVCISSNRNSSVVWNGGFSPEWANMEASIFANTLASLYKSSTVIETIKEGKESAGLFEKIIGLSDSSNAYPIYKTTTTKAEQVATFQRLFHASEASGQFRINEIPAPFSKEDLTRNDVFLLDAWDRIYVWHQKASATEMKKSVESALAYYDLATRDRPGIEKASSYEKSKGNVILVTAGKEPLIFTSRFMAWFPSPKDNLDSHLASGAEFLSQFSQKYTYDELLNKKYPPGLDSTRLEEYLEDDEFEEVLGMGRTEFAALPGWQAQKIKRAKGLF